MTLMFLLKKEWRTMINILLLTAVYDNIEVKDFIN